MVQQLVTMFDLLRDLIHTLLDIFHCFAKGFSGDECVGCLSHLELISVFTKEGTFIVKCIDGVSEFRHFGVSGRCSLRSSVVTMFDVALIVALVGSEVFLLDLVVASCCMILSLGSCRCYSQKS